ncbi:hypothetical protein NDR87_03010 [Nocardia sp. CDC159]|uniref:Ig-like domain-containing protein n=1 Tax=Nocardia pulmonis TaxID=2951408 RepID=A0A9X2E0N5_9NOCA|nr:MULTISPECIES: hypothetical protein [Nocardia]MCM6772017.1 hypothetical protein [Nocardia pulmonis]MCM6785325.1 hypothetical protein [Nocardia sp. CDC159]
MVRFASPVVLAASAGLMIAVAPGAAADVTNLSIDPGASWGPSSRYGTTCSYTLTARTNTAGKVSFYDFTQAATFSPGHYVDTVDGVATVRWTPTQPGTHAIMAYQTSAGGPVLTVQVGNGINTGSACLVLP